MSLKKKNVCPCMLFSPHPQHANQEKPKNKKIRKFAAFMIRTLIPKPFWNQRSGMQHSEMACIYDVNRCCKLVTKFSKFLTPTLSIIDVYVSHNNFHEELVEKRCILRFLQKMVLGRILLMRIILRIWTYKM
ncbi:hypothetical protein O6H91_Y485600 [Diphasiastrum complanatum]|nr:hypothetical protein O6H91_Y485600 [Diphasiastrum complanatum]